MAVYVKRKLVSSNTEDFIIDRPTPLSEIVTRSNMPEVLHDYIDVTIDGILITKEEWETTYAKPNNVVYLAVMPRGGGDSGKNPLAMIAGIALTIFAPYAAGILTGAGGLLAGASASLVGAGIMFVGSLLISALFPPPKPKTPGSADDSSGFFGMEGLRNRARPHGAVRSIYGTYKVSPDLAVESYITTAGDTQTIHAIYDFGYGHIDISSILIGNTSLDSYSGVQYNVDSNYTSGLIPYYENDNITETFSTEIKKDWIVRSSLADDASAMTINMSLPLGLLYMAHGTDREAMSVHFSIQYKDHNADDIEENWKFFKQEQLSASHATVWSENFAKSIDFLDLYIVHGDVNDINSYVYWTVNTGPDFQVETKGIPSAYDTSNALAPQVGSKFIRNGIEYEIISVSQYYSSTVRIVTGDEYDFWGEQITYTNIKRFNIVLDKSFPEEPIITAVKSYWTQDYGDGESWFGTVRHFIWIMAAGNYTTFFTLYGQGIPSFLLRRRTSVPFIYALNLIFPSAGEWDIRIARTDDVLYIKFADSGRYFDKTELVAITSKSQKEPLKFDVPHTILSMQIVSSAQLSGTVDTLTAISQRKIWTWNGVDTWTFEHTSNPAWISLDIIRGDANSDPIPDERIDFLSFYNWSLFCEELVDDGTGEATTEFKYNSDCNFDASSTVYDRLTSIMSTGRATLTMREGRYAVIWEQFPTVPVQLFTSANSWGFKGSKVFTKQPHALKCTFINPLEEWQAIDHIVYNDGYNEVGVTGPEVCTIDGQTVDCTAATYFENITMPLITRSSQAFRDGRYYMAQGKLRPETFTISTDIESLICERGDLIKVQHDVASAGGIPSRIVAISGNTVTLREPVPYEVGPTYKLRVRFGSVNIGEQEEYSVDSVAGEGYEVTLTVEPTQFGVTIGDLCVYGKVTYVTDDFLVKSIAPSSDLTASLTLIPLSPDIALADTKDIPAYDPNISPDIMLYPSCAVGLNQKVSIAYENRIPVANVQVSWIDIGTNLEYEIWTTYDENENFELVDIVKSKVGSYRLFNKKSTLDIDYNKGSAIYIKVIPVNAFGYKAQLEICAPILIVLPYDIEKPGKPLFFAGNITEQTMSFTWLAPNDLDIAGFILKYSPDRDNPSWDNSTAEGNLIPFNVTTIDVNARIGSYMLKTIDTTGNLSNNYSLVKTTIPEIAAMNLVQESIENPTFTGNKTDVILVDDGLELINTGGDGTHVSFGSYDLSTLFNVGGIYRCYLTAQIEGYTKEDYPVSNWEVVSDLSRLTQAVLGEWNTVIQVKTASENGSISDWNYIEDASTLEQDSNWGGWQNLTAGFYTGHYFYFRAVLTTCCEYSTPHITGLKVIVDMPDRTEYGDDISRDGLLAGQVFGKRVTFSKPFNTTTKPVIAITEDNVVEGQYYVLDTIDETGFDIEFYTSVGANGFEDIVVPTDVQFDFIAKGYGEQEDTFYNAVEVEDEDDISQLPVAITNYILL